LKKSSQQNFVVKTLIKLAKTRFECGVPAADFAAQQKFRVLKAALAR
jgi:hypothetical protein